MRSAALLVTLFVLAAAAPSPPPPLSAFAGKYLFNRINGRRLIDLPVVRKAVDGAVYNSTVRSSLAIDGVTSPIEFAQGLLFAGTCEPHNCGDHNWAFVVSDITHKAAVCYHDSDLMDGSRWFMGGRLAAKTPEDCGGGLLSMPQEVTRALQSGPWQR